MDATQLAVWLQGMLEYRDISSINAEEARIMLQGIKDHVALVFKKVTPPAPVQKKELGLVPKDPVPVQIPDPRSFEEHVKRHFEKIPVTAPLVPTPGIWPWPGKITTNPPYDYDTPRYWLDRDSTGAPKLTC